MSYEWNCVRSKNKCTEWQTQLCWISHFVKLSDMLAFCQERSCRTTVDDFILTKSQSDQTGRILLQQKMTNIFCVYECERWQICEVPDHRFLNKYSLKETQVNHVTFFCYAGDGGAMLLHNGKLLHLLSALRCSYHWRHGQKCNSMHSSVARFCFSTQVKLL